MKAIYIGQEIQVGTEFSSRMVVVKYELLFEDGTRMKCTTTLSVSDLSQTHTHEIIQRIKKYHNDIEIQI